MGREMKPIDFGDHPIQYGRLIEAQISTYSVITVERVEPVSSNL